MGNKSRIESLFYSMGLIICISISFIIFGMVTYRTPLESKMFRDLSISAIGFYSSIFQVAILLLLFKYVLKRENEISVHKNGLGVNHFDILIFLFVGIFIHVIVLGGLIYLEDITNTDGIVNLINQEVEVTELDRVYDFIMGVILAPISEELFFRKGVFKYLEGKGFTSRSIILISGISFGLVHLVGFAKPISAIIFGITLASIYAITKNVIYPIIGHGLNNMMSGIAFKFGSFGIFEGVESYIQSSETLEIAEIAISCLILLVIISIISYIKRKTIIGSDFKVKFIRVFTQ